MTHQDDSYIGTRERFNNETVAREYVLKKNTLNSSKNRREMARIIEGLEGLAAGSRVLDLPCGSGRLEPMLLEKGYRVVAADYSQPMIEVATVYLDDITIKPGIESSSHGDPHSPAPAEIVFEQQDVLNTTFEDNAFDAIICNRLLHHYPEAATRRAVLAELRRICRDRLIVSYYDNYALSALKFHLMNRLKGITPNDRIPIAGQVFQADYQASGFTCIKTLPVRYGISPQTYLVLRPVN
ncbi:MAG: hypothetical protein DHS20C01_10430 [marine bacterium B5-7]|nr:MAG: hypothetical protein DHS20C01_10430 [marine bacterium B5-7]